MSEYKIINKHRRGITDLENTYAFYGGSQGDHSVSNSVEDFISAEGWLNVAHNFKLIDYSNQLEVNKRVEEIVAINKARVIELIKDGTYGEEYETETKLNFVPYPLFDAKNDKLDTVPLESYRFVLLDASDLGNVSINNPKNINVNKNE